MSDDVKVTIGVNNAPFRAGLEQMRSQAQKFNGDLRKMAMDSISGWAKVFTAGSIVASLDKIISKAGEIKKLSNQFGVDSQALQRIGNGLAKGDLEAVAPLLNKLIISQQKAREGNKSLSASFTALGVSTADLNSLAPDELLFRIADGAKNATDGGAAYNAVVSVMGKNAGEFFAKLAQGSEELKRNADAIGTYSKAAINSFAGFNREIGRVKSFALPILADVAAFFLRIAATAGAAYHAAGDFAHLGKDLSGFGDGRKGAVNRYMGRLDATGQDAGRRLHEITSPTDSTKTGKRPTGAHAAGYSGDGGEPGTGGGEDPQARINALQAQHAKLVDEQYERSLNSAGLINTLTERKVKLEQEASEADNNGDKEESLQKQNAALEMGLRITQEKQRVAQEESASALRLAAIQRDTQLAGMTAETRIKAMTEERTRLLREANLAQLMGDQSKAGRLRVEAAEKEREAARETRTMDLERGRIAEALSANEQERRMKTMSAEEKILELTRQREQLLREASDAVGAGKPLSAENPPDYDLYGKKQLAASDKQKEIDSAIEDKNSEDKQKATQQAEEADRRKKEHDELLATDQQQLTDLADKSTERDIGRLSPEDQKTARQKQKDLLDGQKRDVDSQLDGEKDPKKLAALKSRSADLTTTLSYTNEALPKQDDPKKRDEIAQHIKEMNAERDGIDAKISGEKDPDKRRKLQIQRATLKGQSDEKADQISDLKKQTQTKFTVTASSLQRAGGGGRAYGTSGTNKAEKQRDDTNRKLDKIIAALGKTGSQNSPPAEAY